MPLTVTPSEDDVVTALRAFLLDIVPTGVEVIQAQANNVPEPKSENFVLMTPLRHTRLATNTDTHDTFDQLNAAMQPTMFDYQVDVHGENGGNICQIITTLIRDEYAVGFFAENAIKVSPLYCDEPKQLPFINAEKQYEERWVVQVSLQVDTVVGFPQQSATELAIDVVSVDAEFPA